MKRTYLQRNIDTDEQSRYSTGKHELHPTENLLKEQHLDPKGLQHFKRFVRMKPIFFLFIVSLLLFSGVDTTKLPVDYVNPLIGTGFHGHTYPGATTPFGTVQLSPDTRCGNWDACSGYHYNDSTIMGFSHTHLSGTGCIDLGDILFHPANDGIPGEKKDLIFKPLLFSHKNEVAEAGYYKVKLDNGIQVELTATTHVGVHRYTFPENGNPKIIIDLAHLLSEETINEAELQLDKDEIVGMRNTSGWTPNQYIYFVARFSVPFNAEFLSDGEIVSINEPIRGKNLQTILSFSKEKEKPVIVKVGISSVSIENARQNIDQETTGFDFDQIKEQTRNEWNRVLSAFKVSGCSNAEMVNFYTAVYHSMVVPNQISDADGQYRGLDQKIRISNGRKVYSTLSLWDTFRTWNPMMTLTDTALVNNMINSLLNFYDQTGELPVWPLSSGETGTMIGYHSISVIYDAFSKNIRNYDCEKAFEAMKVSSNKNSKGTTPYLELGYIPSNSKKESVSCLLENAYDDWCIAQMAKVLGHKTDYEQYNNRAKLYQNVFDGSTKFFRPRQNDGLWETPFNPIEVGRAYTEATAWQYRFFVPHDINGLINLMGGKDNFTTILDSLFIVASEMSGQLSDISGMIGQYAHGNEPSHHMAYLFNYVGQPWKTQQMVRKILNEMYLPTPEGIVGNEDCGQMSAWYVMSSLGLYPVCPGSGQFILTSPIFESSIIHLANGKELNIKANDPSENTYIKEVYLNDKLIVENYVSYSQLMAGGELRFVLAAQPNFKRGTTLESYPYSLTKENEVSIPFVSNDPSFFNQEVKVECGSATNGAEIRYTLDGSEPTENSMLYEKPITLNETTTIKLKAFKNGMNASSVSAYIATKAVYQLPSSLIPGKNGVNYQYFEGDFARTSDIRKIGKLVKSGICNQPTLSISQISDYYGIIYSGYLYAPSDGVYTFSTQSDDGSLLRIGEQTVVDNDGSHGEIKASGRIALKKGYHPYELLYFESYEGESLYLNWVIPGSEMEKPITSENLFIK